MATIDQISQAQFVDLLRAALLSRSRRYDTGTGSILDVVFNPVAAVLEDQNNNRLRKVALLLSLQNSTEFSESDLNALVYNEDILRPAGSNATALLTFKRGRPFTSAESGLIPRGFPIGTSVDEGSGQAVTFVTTEARDKTFATAMLDTSTNTTVYVLQVPVVCLVSGSAGQVGPDRINRPLRPLVGWDSVTNTDSSQEGRDRYSNDELIELYLLAVAGRQLSVPSGNEFYIRDNFASVIDVHEVFGTDPLLTRAATDAGAVDAFVIGDNTQTVVDQVPFLGLGQKLVLSLPPVVRVDSVTRVSDGHIFVEGADYVVALDSTGVSGSVRGQDGIVFLATANPVPASGDVLSISYAYNQLVRDLQANESDREVKVDGRDLLYRMGSQVDVFISANLTVLTGFRTADIQTSVQNAILNYVNGLTLGQAVEAFGIESAVAKISGVYNFVITKLTRSATSFGTSDIPMAGSEYARSTANNLTITPTN